MDGDGRYAAANDELAPIEAVLRAAGRAMTAQDINKALPAEQK